MKILHAVEFYYPSVGGAQAVVQQISECLAARGHEVTVATSYVPERSENIHRGVKIVPFGVTGNTVRGMRGEVERYQEFVRDGEYDVILVYAAQQWTCDALLSILDQIRAKKVFAPCGFSGLHEAPYQEYFERMPDLLRKFDVLVFHSTSYRDVQFARARGLRNWVMIPNGAAVDEFEPVPRSFKEKFDLRSTSMILTVGSHTGMKGHRVVLDAFRRAQIEDATLVIVGNRVDGGCAQDCLWRTWVYNRLPGIRSRKKAIRALSLERADVIAAYQAADVFLFASSIECSPLVLFEAMAAGCAFATTPVGNSAEVVEWSQGGILIPARENSHGYTISTPDRVAAAIEMLIHDSGLRRRLGRQGQAAWRERFTFERIAVEYERLYQRLVDCETVLHDA